MHLNVQTAMIEELSQIAASQGIDAADEQFNQQLGALAAVDIGHQKSRSHRRMGTTR